MKTQLTCYIIDDEHLAQEILEEYVGKVPFLALKGIFNSALEAAAQIKQDSPDLLFLDINMPDLDGLSLIPMLNPAPMIILTTAYDDYALKAFELEVSDYLLKPFSFERFYKGVLKVYGQFTAEQQVDPGQGKGEQEYIFLKVGHRIQRIAVAEILLIEGMKDYLRLHTAREKIMTLTSFAKLEELLPPQQFVRVHRSFMVALNKIDYIEKNRIFIANQHVPISDTYAEEFYNLLNGTK